MLDHISSHAQRGRQGLGFRYCYRKVESRAEITERMKKEAEEKRLIVLHQYEMQASWLSWGLDKMMKSDLGWQTMLYQYSQNLVLNSQTNTLPTSVDFVVNKKLLYPTFSLAARGCVTWKTNSKTRIGISGAITMFSC